MGPINSARVHCSKLTSQLLRAEQKKKKKEREKRRIETQTPESVQLKRVHN